MWWVLVTGCGGEVGEVLRMEGDAETGARTFEVNCSVCHGFEEIEGTGPAMETIVPYRTREEIVEAILYGYGEKMPAQDDLSHQEVADILAWLEATFSP